MTKFFSLSLVLLILVSAQPKRSEAVVGLVTGFVPVMVLGGLIGAVGVTEMVTVAQNTCPGNGSCQGGIIGVLAFIFGEEYALATTAVGVVLLDSHTQSATLEFANLDNTQMESFGFTPAEETSYPLDLQKINLVTATVTREAMDYQKQSHPTEAQMQDFIAAAWANEGAALSPEDLSAMKKISQAFADKARTAH